MDIEINLIGQEPKFSTPDADSLSNFNQNEPSLFDIPESFPSKLDIRMEDVNEALIQANPGLRIDGSELDESFLLRNESENIGYTYELKSVEQLNGLISSYKEHLEQLSGEDIEYYDKFIEAYEKSAETCDFKSNLEAKKAFLALKKLDKYGYDTSAFQKQSPNRINENSEILGQYSNDLNKMKKISKNDYKYDSALKDFYKQLYLSDTVYCCLNGDDKEAVEAEARKMYDAEDEKYSDNLQECYELAFRSATYVNDIDNEWNNWELQILISGDCEGKENQYLPQDLVTLHELYHAKQATPGEPESYNDGRYKELGAVMDSAVRSDEIHKKLNNIPMDEIVEYPKTFTTTSGEEINLGRLVNEFRTIKETNGFENWEQVFTSEEGMELIKNYFGN